jgi:hypothetical protein
MKRGLQSRHRVNSHVGSGLKTNVTKLLSNVLSSIGTPALLQILHQVSRLAAIGLRADVSRQQKNARISIITRILR